MTMERTTTVALTDTTIQAPITGVPTVARVGNKEHLEKQLELLAKASAECVDRRCYDSLYRLTDSMIVVIGKLEELARQQGFSKPSMAPSSSGDPIKVTY